MQGNFLLTQQYNHRKTDLLTQEETQQDDISQKDTFENRCSKYYHLTSSLSSILHPTVRNYKKHNCAPLNSTHFNFS